jgi:potassium-transporting ATPase KdpC subunit
MHPARTALKMLLTMIVLTGVVYPLLMTLLSQLLMPEQANGSLIEKQGRVIGSKLIAQNFKGDSYFWPRPSAVNFNPIQPAGGSNLGPTSHKLKMEVAQRLKMIGSDAPGELIYASGSGLDPHISLATAYYQIERVAKARHVIDPTLLHSLVDSMAEGLHRKYINVLLLNEALDHHFPISKP